MAVPPRPIVSDFEIAALVHVYLESSGYKKTAASFKREAKELFKDSALPPAGQFKHLPTLVAEYIALHNNEAQRNALQTINPLARSLYNALDSHAGVEALPQQPSTMTALYYQPCQADGVAQNHNGSAFGLFGASMPKHREQQQLIHQGQLALQGMQPPSNYNGLPSVVGQANLTGQTELLPSGQKQTTPGRHALRKGAPRKRRKLDFAAHEQHLASPEGSARVDNEYSEYHPLDLPPELLNMSMNPESLEELLTDAEKQTRFAQGLAQIINQKKGFLPAQENSQAGQFGNDDLDWIHWLTAPGGTPVMGEAKGDLRSQPSMDNGTNVVKAADDASSKETGRVASANQGNHAATTMPFPKPSINLSEEIARYMQRPQDFEDLIDECIG